MRVMEAMEMKNQMSLQRPVAHPFNLILRHRKFSLLFRTSEFYNRFLMDKEVFPPLASSFSLQTNTKSKAPCFCSAAPLAEALTTES